MDTLISYDEVADALANPPTLTPRPNFNNLRSLRRHMQRALQRLSCPQSNILGWSGFVMARPMYLLLSPMAFILPMDPGPQAVYFPRQQPLLDANGDPDLDVNGNQQFPPLPVLARATIATIDASFNRARNYWRSYENIKRACYNMLDDNIDDAFKVSNNPALTGWNPSMNIIDMIDQLVTTYGRPTPVALLTNDTLFRSAYSPVDAPEVLFRRIETCQEIQVLGDDPYTAVQLLNNAVRLLLACGLYQRDFEEWDRRADADKTYLQLKPFIQEAFQRRLNASGNTTGQQGYVQNAFNALAEDSDADIDDDIETIVTQLAAMTNQSQLTAASTAATSNNVNAAITQLAANQQTMMNQLMAYGAAARDGPNRTRVVAGGDRVQYPGVTNFTIPAMGTFQPTGQVGRGGGRGRGGRAANQGGRRNPRTPFANYTARNSGGGGGIPAFVPAVIGGVTPARNTAPMYSNIVKHHNNMNACFSCGFDIEDGHNSRTCPTAWRRANHQEAYDRNNAQAYIDAGYDACTKAKHKTQLPNF